MNQQQNAMQDRKIANPEDMTMPKTPEMNCRDYINDGLSTCKYIADGLNVAVPEASHKALFDDLSQMLQETHDCGREMYDIMFQNGWYTFEAEQQTKIDQIKQQFTGYKSQFPS